jgi:Holliday junction resolvasome RuvABC endonuclease subunit
MKKKAVSFDPASFRNLGWAVTDISYTKKGGTSLACEAGTFVMQGNEPWKVLWPVFLVVDHFLDVHDPDVVIIESTAAFAGGFVTGQVANCIGVILACCMKHDADVKFLYPSHVKKVVSGKGRATKSVMKKAVKKHLDALGVKDSKFDSEHAYDAVANILCWIIENPKISYKEKNNE